MAKPATDATGNMADAIVMAIRAEAERLKEECIVKAVSDFEHDLRQTIAKASMTLTNYYEVERQGQRLIISVQVGNP